jgi:hypothetical protein
MSLTVLRSLRTSRLTPGAGPHNVFADSVWRPHRRLLFVLSLIQNGGDTLVDRVRLRQLRLDWLVMVEGLMPMLLAQAHQRDRFALRVFTDLQAH